MTELKEEFFDHNSHWFMKQVKDNISFQTLIDDFNSYVNKLLTLVTFVEDEEERKSLLKELDDDLTYMANKEENKETTRNLLLDHVEDKEKFESALKLI